MSREHRGSPRASADVMRLGGWLVAEAARSPLGHDAASYQALLEDARISVDKGEPGRWFPFAALTQVLLWQNRPRDAADLAEWTIATYRDDVDVEWPITAEIAPLRDALLVERLITDVADPQRVDRVAAQLDPTTVLGSSLQFATTALVDGRPPLNQLVSGYENWDELEQPLHAPYDDMWRRLDRLRPAEIQRLWPGVHASRNITLARELSDRFGVTTPLWDVRAWIAGWQVRNGDLTGAQTTLRAGLELCEPLAVWDVLEISPVTRPALLPAATDDFRLEVLRRASDKLPWTKKRRRR